jgi:hypothetical protein
VLSLIANFDTLSRQPKFLPKHNLSYLHTFLPL